MCGYAAIAMLVGLGGVLSILAGVGFGKLTRSRGGGAACGALAAVALNVALFMGLYATVPPHADQVVFDQTLGWCLTFGSMSVAASVAIVAPMVWVLLKPKPPSEDRADQVMTGSA